MANSRCVLARKLICCGAPAAAGDHVDVAQRAGRPRSAYAIHLLSGDQANAAAAESAADESGGQHALLLRFQVDHAQFFAIAHERDALAVGRKARALVGQRVARQLRFGVMREIVQEDVGDRVALAQVGDARSNPAPR